MLVPQLRRERARLEDLVSGCSSLPLANGQWHDVLRPASHAEPQVGPVRTATAVQPPAVPAPAATVGQLQTPPPTPDHAHAIPDKDEEVCDAYVDDVDEGPAGADDPPGHMEMVANEIGIGDDGSRPEMLVRMVDKKVC